MPIAKISASYSSQCSIHSVRSGGRAPSESSLDVLDLTKPPRRSKPARPTSWKGARKVPGIGAPGNGDASERGPVRGITKLTVLLAVLVFATSLYANLPYALGLQWFYRYVPPFSGQHSRTLVQLGGEHRSIATALSAGRGFADPFNERTGPTAWVAPVLPTIQALLLALGGINLAVIVISFFQNMTLVFTGWLVLRAAARCRWPHAPVVSLVLFIASTWVQFVSSYQYTHDSWLVMLMIGVLVYMADCLWASFLAPGPAACWGFIGGAAMLSAPGLGPAWVALAPCWPDRREESCRSLFHFSWPRLW